MVSNLIIIDTSVFIDHLHTGCHQDGGLRRFAIDTTWLQPCKVATSRLICSFIKLGAWL
jgi:hypothetical protein